MNWNIVIDSSCDLTTKNFECKNASFDIVPLKILVGDKEFVDEENVDVAQLLSAMSLEKKASSSACPSPDSFAQCFIKADNVICITMTSALSGTNNSARLAKDIVLETNPEKNIHILDSHSTAGDMVLLARKADSLIGQGLPFEQVCEKLEEYNKEISLVFTLVQYDNLIKTGRMKPLVGAIATHLGIRAVAINTTAGEIEVVKKIRGEEKVFEAMAEIMNKFKNMTNKPVVISHCKNLSGAEKMKQVIKDKCKTSDVTILDCKALTSFYSMQNGMLIGY